MRPLLHPRCKAVQPPSSSPGRSRRSRYLCTNLQSLQLLKVLRARSRQRGNGGGRRPAAAAGTAAGTEAAAAVAPLFVPLEWLHFGVAIGAFTQPMTCTRHSRRWTSSSRLLVGMFGILSGLCLDAAGQLGAAEKIVAAARPALAWAGRYLPLLRSGVGAAARDRG